MTLALVQNPFKVIGLSTDTKPNSSAISSANAGPGTEFYESDTGNTFIWNGSAWKKKTPLIDGMTGATAIIPTSHLHVHEGGSFVFDYVDEALADNATIVLAFKTPTGTKRVHFFPEFTTLVGGDMQVYEDTFWTGGTGSAQSVINRKREDSMDASIILENVSSASAFIANGKIIVNPTGHDGSAATVIRRLYGWGKKEKFNADGRDENELLLNPDTTYAVVFTAEGGSNKAQLVLNWYEHTDKA